MKNIFLSTLMLALIGVSNISVAQHLPLDKKWLHIYAPEGISSFNAIPFDSIANLSFVKDPLLSDESGEESGFNLMQVNFKNGTNTLRLPLDNIDKFDISGDIPLIDITLDEYPDVNELWQKDLYLNATVNIDGAGEFEDINAWQTKIKGRGNSTWGFRKKPYRFKAPKKISLLGMKKAKSYALIANYIDSSHMRNFVALRLAQLLNIPFSNSIVPVRVRFNNIDKGLYFLTEKIGIGGASVDIDEEKGWLFELDEAMDEDYCYFSEPYGLPVMVKDPDLKEVYPDNTDAQWELMKADFNNVLSHVQSCQDESWKDMIDSESLVNYLIVFNLALNIEIRHPKSVYIYKPAPDDKYYFGPVWDFDWAYHYSSAGDNSVDPDFPLFHPNCFFYDLCKLPGLEEEFVARWDYMIENIFPQLIEEMDAYAKKIKPAALSDALIWPDKPDVITSNTFDFDLHYQALRSWIDQRIAAAADHPCRLLYYIPGYKW